jgi:hypothetical protein
MESSDGFLHRVPDQNSETQFFVSFFQATGLPVNVVLNRLKGFSTLFFGNFIDQFLVILVFILTKVNPINLMVTFVFSKQSGKN